MQQNPTQISLIFLSTPSVRRATCGYLMLLTVICISIHALREEGDDIVFHKPSYTIGFLSTPSVRRATCTHLVLHTR